MQLFSVHCVRKKEEGAHVLRSSGATECVIAVLSVVQTVLTFKYTVQQKEEP
jgi:hypothetical protein